MSVQREQFQSRFGFLLAATGAAVGLGNIWGFPSQAANNGGAAFIIVYLLLALLIAFPALMAELLIGQHGRANPVDSMQAIPGLNRWQPLGRLLGFSCLLGALAILSFYSIVAGWMIGYSIEPIMNVTGLGSVGEWLKGNGIGRNLVLTASFISLTALIINKGVKDGIEVWSRRLMPLFILTLVILAIYVMTREGAMEGLNHYLIPDFSHFSQPKLFISAMGQAFFSVGVGVGAMMVYGSYLDRKENLPQLAIYITLMDTGIAFLAGFLIIPAMFVAQRAGIMIFDGQGQLLSQSTLIFEVLPALFGSLGNLSGLITTIFFTLLFIAALTSTISTMEVPVAYFTEKTKLNRHKATSLVALIIMIASAIIVFNFDWLFGVMVVVVTQYMLPIVGLLFCLFVGWLWSRDKLMTYLIDQSAEIRNHWFARVWPWYVRTIVPMGILVIFIQSQFAS